MKNKSNWKSFLVLSALMIYTNPPHLALAAGAAGAEVREESEGREPAAAPPLPYRKPLPAAAPKGKDILVIQHPLAGKLQTLDEAAKDPAHRQKHSTLERADEKRVQEQERRLKVQSRAVISVPSNFQHTATGHVQRGIGTMKLETLGEAEARQRVEAGRRKIKDENTKDENTKNENTKEKIE